MKRLASPMQQNARLLLHQRGQATTEFLIIAAVLIPLFLLVPVIAKYQDISYHTQMASRYAAFDTLVRNSSQNSAKPLDQLQDEVRRRFFSNTDAPIKTLDVAGDFKANQNLFWRTPDDKSLITNFSDITVTQGVQGSYDGQSMKGPFAFTFGATGINTANVNVVLANLPTGLKFYEPFDQINLSINRGTAVIADVWTSKNPAVVQDTVAGLVPNVTVLSVLSPIIDPTMVVVEPGVSPPKLGQLDYWRDDVPTDRLVSL